MGPGDEATLEWLPCADMKIFTQPVSTIYMRARKDSQSGNTYGMRQLCRQARLLTDREGGEIPLHGLSVQSVLFSMLTWRLTCPLQAKYSEDLA